MKSLKMMLGLVLLLAVSGAAVVRAQSGEDAVINASADAQKQLASRDPFVRQRAAEDLAGLASPDNRKLLEGYRLQEKNARVKLALDWALYRIGKSDALFAVVRALDSQRADQAKTYLISMERPEPLYIFMERVNGNTQLKLLEVLAKIGDAGTVEKIQPFLESFDPKVSEAAQAATREIEQRLGQQPQPENSTRPRQVGNGENTP
ncbi:MAG TPA: HEAT repeat domain-containing protein [Pyrinomonadaceae bacterium]|nr:HEAT repeat domain-containing protein [Pyrinomonadaceae bacterium]